MMGTDFPSTSFLPPRDGAEMFEDLADELGAGHVTFGNLEGPLCDGGMTSKCGADTSSCFAFRTPTRYAEHVANGGFDLVSLANNHALDFGESCRTQTIEAVEAFGIGWSGPVGSIGHFQTEHGLLALVAFHTAQHSNWVNDHDAAAELVAQAAAGADIVIVSFHGGAEGASALHVPDGPETFFGENRGDLRRFARAVIDAGADLVLGHGPHVPRGMEVHDGRLIAYSLGNFATYGRFSLSGPKGISYVLQVLLEEDGRFAAARIHSAKLVDGGIPVGDPDEQALGLIEQLSTEDFGDTAVRFVGDATFGPP